MQSPPAVLFFHPRELGFIDGKLLIGGNVVGHFVLVEFFVGHHIEVAGAGQSEDDGLGFAGFLALQCLVDRHTDRVRRFGCRQNAFDPCEVFGGFKDLGLLNGDRLHQTVRLQLGKRRAHAMVAESAGVTGGGDKVTAEGIHFGKRTHHTGVAEVVGVGAAREAGAGGRLYGDEAVVGFAAELFAHEGRDQSAEVGAAAGTADDDIGFFAVFVKRGLGFKTDDRLVQHDLI